MTPSLRCEVLGPEPCGALVGSAMKRESENPGSTRTMIGVPQLVRGEIVELAEFEPAAFPLRKTRSKPSGQGIWLM